MKNKETPKVVRERYNAYVKTLKKLKEKGYENVNSSIMAQEFVSYEIDSSTVRRDLNYLGKFGRQGYGYDINELISRLTIEVGIGNHEDILLFGVGNMGKALLKYNYLDEKVGNIIAGFDINVDKGQKIDGIPIYDYKDFGSSYSSNARIAIIAVPTAIAQEVVDKVIKYGIKAIINFSDADLIVKSKRVIIKNIDLSYFIQEVIYNLKINNLK